MSDVSRQVMDDWVYAERQLRTSFDADLLAKHAMAQLARSLNTHRLIAVIGSGVSNGYGQPSWTELLLSAAEVIEEQFLQRDPELSAYVSAVRSGKSVEAHALRKRVAEAAPIIDTFLEMRLVRGADSYPTDKMPIAFEVCENLVAALQIRSKEKSGEDISHKREARRAHKTLRDWIRWQLRDERGRVELLLRRLRGRPRFQRDAHSLAQLQVLQDEIFCFSLRGEGPSKDEDRRAGRLAHLLYRAVPRQRVSGDGLEAYHDLRAKARDGVVDGVSLIIPRLWDLGRPDGVADPNETLARMLARWLWSTKSDGPSVHYLIDAAMELLSPNDVLGVFTELLEQVSAEEKGTGFDTDAAERRTVRALTPRHRDPLAVIIDDLKIQRLLTTNYDGEIDHLLTSRGYSPILTGKDADLDRSLGVASTEPAPSRSLLVNALSGRAEILAYEAGAASYLYDYGTDTRDQRIQVLHIHGRVQSPGSWLVLSERDYRERYAREDDPHTRADEAMRLIFTSNPLLFLGLGMREPDILRPLRAFSEDISRLCDRPAIALLPREAIGGDAAKAQVESLARYGVYSLYYGSAQLRSGQSDPDFMARLLKIQGAAWNYLDGHDLRYAPAKDLSPLEARVERVEAGRPGVYALTALQRQLALVHKSVSGLSGRDSGREQRRRKLIDDWRKRQDHAPKGIESVAAASRIETTSDESSPRPTFLRLSEDVVERHRAALSVLNLGIGGALKTTFMTAWLRRMVDEWASWRDSWSSAPNRREPGGGRGRKVGDHIVTTRHRTLLRDLDLERSGGMAPAMAPVTDRFFAGAPSPAFQVLRAALTGQVSLPSRGRRIFYLLSERGAGRGHVFSSMRSPRRFAHLCSWLGLADEGALAANDPQDLHDDPAIAATDHISRAFFNMGMSHEVISTFDRLARFLEDFAEHISPVDEQVEFRRQCDSLAGDRLGRLLNAMRRLDRLGPQVRRNGGLARAVIVINHLSILFEAGGRPKNAQVRRLFDILIDRAFARAPIDFIFMMNEHQLPDRLKDSATGRHPTSALRLIAPFGLQSKARRHLHERIAQAFGFASHLETQVDRFGVVLGEKADADPGGEAPDGARIYVHFLPWMRPATLATRFFPRAAASLLFLGERADPFNSIVYFGDKPPGSPKSESERLKWFSDQYYPANVDQQLAFETEEEVRSFQAKVREQFEFHLTDLPRKSGEHGDGVSSSEASIAGLGVAFAGEAIETVMLAALRAYRTGRHARAAALAAGRPPPDPLEVVQAAIENGLLALSGGRSIVPDIEGDGRPEERQALSYFERIATAVGHNRYAMTIILAAIDDMISRRLPGRPENVVDLAVVVSFIERLQLATAGKAPSGREDIAVAHVLQHYQTDTVSAMGHDLGAWPFVPQKPSGTGVWKALLEARQPLLFDLQERLLVTLALIGQPVEAAVLTGVQSVAASLGALIADCEIPEHESQDCLLTVLDLLVHRCLIFRVAPKGAEDIPEARRRHRFVTHKSVRRHLYRQLNAPVIDYSEVDQLTVSLYATQPSDLPRPTAEGHRRIRHLIDQLSRFEKGAGEPGHAAPDPFLPEGISEAEKVRVDRARLRAAYGALRSIYSVGVISRFSSYEDEGIETPENGYFEAHRLRVRWMLRTANHLDGAWTRDRSESQPPPGDAAELLRTFHAEEIVWLFNECGVLSLAQGRMNDAAALLSQASRTARDFLEAPGWGPLLARIAVNWAVADIQRGKLREAERQLRHVRDEGVAEHPALVLIAEGYLVLIDELRGDAQGAAEAYVPIIDRLIAMGRFRTAAIFTIQRADALRALGREGAREAMQVSARACDLAARGGHEDIRQIGALAQVWSEIVAQTGAIAAEARRSIETRLDEIAAYARMMGMPRLTCSVSLCRGEFVFGLGDYRRASELAQEALRIAIRHEIELRKIAALRLLGASMQRLDLPEARTLLMRARELAYHADYTSAISRIEQILAERREPTPPA